jgi:ribosomal protein L6P/L9E
VAEIAFLARAFPGVCQGFFYELSTEGTFFRLTVANCGQIDDTVGLCLVEKKVLEVRFAPKHNMLIRKKL